MQNNNGNGSCFNFREENLFVLIDIVDNRHAVSLVIYIMYKITIYETIITLFLF